MDLPKQHPPSVFLKGIPRAAGAKAHEAVSRMSTLVENIMEETVLAARETSGNHDDDNLPCKVAEGEAERQFVYWASRVCVLGPKKRCVILGRRERKQDLTPPLAPCLCKPSTECRCRRVLGVP